MEELQSMLLAYNQSHLENLEHAPWSKQYCESIFPTYWLLVYKILSKLDRNLRILEVGCGLGDVTSIPCYLDYKSITAFEKVPENGKRAERKISVQIPFDMRSVIPAICGHSFFKYFYGCKVNVLIRHLGQ